MKYLRTIVALLAGAALCTRGVAAASSTKVVTENRFNEWINGTPRSVHVEPDDVLRLGGDVVRTAAFAFAALDAVAYDGTATWYVAVGSTVLACEPGSSNQVALRFESERATALAYGPDGLLYVGATPGGVVYRRERNGNLTRVADTGQRYIWVLRFVDPNTLLAGTGPNGIVCAIDLSIAPPQCSVLFDSAEENVTALALQGRAIIAGTAPRGRIYRIESATSVFALVETKTAEVTSLHCDPDGTIWAATMGGVPAVPTATALSPSIPQQGMLTGGVVTSSVAPTLPEAQRAKLNDDSGATLLVIGSNGFVETYWRSPESALCGLTRGADGTLYAGSGNRGRVYALRGRGRAALVVQVASRQIVALSQTSDDALWIAGTEPPALYMMGMQTAPSGRFESAVIEADEFARWGRLVCEPADAAGVTILTRAGNTDKPDNTWSDWRMLDVDGRIVSPCAAYLQYAVEMRRVGEIAPVIKALHVYYASPNRAPVLDAVIVGPPAVKMLSQPALAPVVVPVPSIEQILQSFETMQGKRSVVAPASVSAKAQAGLQLVAVHAFRTIVWRSYDPDGDQLEARVWLSAPELSLGWAPLAWKIRDGFCSFDSREWPDGRYRAKVEVSDAPANPRSDVQTADLLSDEFMIDNTPPTISTLNVTRENNMLRVSFTATDALSVVRSASYCIDARTRKPLRPVDGVFDSTCENFEVVVELPAEATVIRVFVADEYHNIAARCVPVPR